MTKAIHITLPENILKEIEKLAKKSKRNRSNMISMILEKYIENKEKGDE